MKIPILFTKTNTCYNVEPIKSCKQCLYLLPHDFCSVARKVINDVHSVPEWCPFLANSNLLNEVIERTAFHFETFNFGQGGNKMKDTLGSLLEHLGFPIHVEVVNYRTSGAKEVKELLSNPCTISNLQEYLRKSLNDEYKLPADFNFAFVNVLSWDYKERINGTLSVTFLIQVLLKKQKDLPNLNFNLTKWVQFFFIEQVELLQELRQASCDALVVNKDVHLPENSSDNTEIIYHEGFVFPIITDDNKSNSERCDVCVDIKIRIPNNITVENLKENFSLPFILMCDKVIHEFWETLVNDLSKIKNQES